MTSVNEKPIKKVRHGFTRITGTSLPLTAASKQLQPSQPPAPPIKNKTASTTAAAIPKATTTTSTMANRTSNNTTTKAAVTTTTKAVTTKSKSKASDNSNTEDPHDAAVAALKAKELRKRVVEAHLLVGNKQLTPSASSASASNMAKAQRRSSNTLLSGPRMVTSFHDFVKGGPLPTRLNNLKLCKSKTSTVETDGTSPHEHHQDSGGSDPEEEEETTSMAQLPTTFNNNIVYSQQQQQQRKKKSCCAPPRGNTNVQQTQIRAQQQQLLLSPQEHQELLESGLLAATDLPPVVFDSSTNFIPNEQDVIVGVEVIAEDFRVNYDFQLLVQNNAVAFRDALRNNTPQRKNTAAIRNIVKNILHQITVRGGRFVTPTKTTTTSTNHREDQQEQGPPPRWVEVNRNIAERFTLHELHNYCVHKLPIREAVLAHAASSVQAQSVAKEYHDTIASLLLKTASVQNHHTTAAAAVNGHTTTTATTTSGGVSSSQNNNIKVILPTQFARRVSPPDLHVSSPSTYYESDEQNSNNDTTSSSSPKQSQESKSSSPSSPTIALDLLSIVAAEMATIEDEIKPPATKKVRIH